MTSKLLVFTALASLLAVVAAEIPLNCDCNRDWNGEKDYVLELLNNVRQIADNQNCRRDLNEKEYLMELLRKLKIIVLDNCDAWDLTAGEVPPICASALNQYIRVKRDFKYAIDYARAWCNCYCSNEYYPHLNFMLAQAVQETIDYISGHMIMTKTD